MLFWPAAGGRRQAIGPHHERKTCFPLLWAFHYSGCSTPLPALFRSPRQRFPPGFHPAASVKGPLKKGSDTYRYLRHQCPQRRNKSPPTPLLKKKKKRNFPLLRQAGPRARTHPRLYPFRELLVDSVRVLRGRPRQRSPGRWGRHLRIGREQPGPVWVGWGRQTAPVWRGTREKARGSAGSGTRKCSSRANASMRANRTLKLDRNLL